MKYNFNNITSLGTSEIPNLPATTVYQVQQGVWGADTPFTLSFLTEEERKDWVRKHDRLTVLTPEVLEGIDLWYALLSTEEFLEFCNPDLIPVD